MKLQNNSFLSIEQLQDRYLNREYRIQPEKKAEGFSFQEILKQKAVQNAEPLKFSKHAANRLMDRSIELTDSQMARLNDGTRKAGEKGIRESLVMVDQLAFIVNIPNHTVITAMNQAEANENIFTNIDGAVII